MVFHGFWHELHIYAWNQSTCFNQHINAWKHLFLHMPICPIWHWARWVIPNSTVGKGMKEGTQSKGRGRGGGCSWQKVWNLILTFPKITPCVFFILFPTIFYCEIMDLFLLPSLSSYPSDPTVAWSVVQKSQMMTTLIGLEQSLCSTIT